MIFVKYILFTIISYFILLSSFIYLSFIPIKNDIIINTTKVDLLEISNFEEKIQKFILNNNYNKMEILFNNLTNTEKFDNIQIKYTDYYITTNSILLHSNNITTKDWILSDISIDVKYGELSKFNDTTYKFTPDEDYEFIESIQVKFQALNDNNMQNSISTISFILPTFRNIDKIKPNEQDFIAFIKTKLIETLNLNTKYQESKLYIDGINQFATISYKFNNNNLYEILTKTFYTMFINFNFLFFILLFSLMAFNYYILRTRFIKHLKELELYTNDINTNKFYKYDVKKLEHKDIVNIALSLGKLSKKMASIINELNVNRGRIDLQVSTDTLTQLPNSKIFEQDMKALFLTDIKSYIISLKIECLKEYAKNNSQSHTNLLITTFVDIFQDAIKVIDDKHIKGYRFYGSEFTLIAKFTSYDKTNKLLELITKNISALNEELNIKDKILHAVAIPFDHYSTTDKLLEQLNLEHNNTVDKSPTNSFHLLDHIELDEEDIKLEKLVTSIITNDAFSLSYRFDTYLFSEKDTLIMQEVSANLLNIDGTPIPIGTFISVAEHINLATSFDKQLIIKTFKYIKQKKITHDLAINISISALQDPGFITWLGSQLLYDYKNIINQIVFSVTTFAVKNNFDLFSTFVTELHKFNGRILLKRFSYNDLSLEQLEKLDLDFLRVHKDYTTNIDSDRSVILKNIINFSVIHDIKVLGDMVSDEEDYKMLKSLKFYATSK